MYTDYPRDPPGLVWESVWTPAADTAAVSPPPLAAALAPEPEPPPKPLQLHIGKMSGKHPQLYIHIPPALHRALDRPSRIDIRREDGALVLAPCTAGGWAATKSCTTQTRRLCCNGAAALLAGMIGVYRVAVRDGRAIVGEKVG